jgi:hypothetical protein
MKSFNNFLNESNQPWEYYSTGSTKKLAEMLKGVVKPVFSIIEIGDPEIAKYVSIFYDGYSDTFIVSNKINFKRDHYERRKFLTFEFDEHRNHCEICFEISGELETYLLAQLISAFGEHLGEFTDVVENIWNHVSGSRYEKEASKFTDIKQFCSSPEVKKIILAWEEDYEKKIPTEILTKLGLPLVFVTSRKYGL